MRDPSLAPAANPIAGKDVAETFKEEDLTLSHTRTWEDKENVRLSGSIERYPDGSQTSSQTGDAGVMVNPNTSLSEFQVQLHSKCANVSELKVVLDSDGTVVNNVTGDFAGGDLITVSANVSSGTSYRLVAGNQGNSYTRALDGGNPSTLLNDFDVETGVYANSSTFDNIYNFQMVRTDTNSTSGTVYVEWPNPSDVYRWDAATFQRSVENETVDIYVEEDDGTGWTEIAGPIERGQEITADPANECRFRVELSRADTANNPTLDSIYRRWVV